MSRLKLISPIPFISLGAIVLAAALGLSFPNSTLADGPPPGIDPGQPRYGWALYVPSKMQDPPDQDQAQGQGHNRYIQASASSTATAGDCTYMTRSDNLHESGNDISVHGWWEIVQPSTCPSRADVTTELQGVWCDFWIGRCWWRRAGGDDDRIRPSGGRGKRVTARVTCVSNEATGFRSMVDVDLPGVVDPANKAYSEPEDFSWPSQQLAVIRDTIVHIIH